MEVKNGTIYKLSTPNGEVYIGQTVNLKGRLTYHKNAFYRYDSRLYTAMRNCGWDLVEKTVLFEGEATKELLDDLEIHYIRLYNSFNSKHGLNMVSGGKKNSKFSDELIKKMSEIVRPPQDPEQGRKGGLTRMGHEVTEETRRKLSIAHTGKKMSPEACKKMSDYWSGRPSNKRGIKYTEAQKAKMQGVNSKAIISTVLNKEWPSSRAVALEIGCNPCTINHILKGRMKNKLGLQFKVQE